jgi:hypothetical protein
MLPGARFIRRTCSGTGMPGINLPLIKVNEVAEKCNAIRCEWCTLTGCLLIGICSAEGGWFISNQFIDITGCINV